MSNYTKIENFTAKDALSTGDPLKLIKGSYFDAEFDAIATAITSKYDSGNLASQVQAEAGSAADVLMTPLRTQQWGDDNAGIVGDLRAITAPGEDKLLAWDESGGAAVGMTLGAGLEFSGTTVNLADAVAGAGLVIASSIAAVGAGFGITVNADDIQITDVTAGAAQPVAITNGTFTFDLSSITEISASGLDQAADGILINDAGTLKVLPIDQAGIKVVNAADAIQTFALTDATTIQVLDSASTRVWTIPANAAVAFDVGTVILVQSLQSTITITADTGVTLTSRYNTAGTTATSDTVKAGGRAALVKVATDEWTIEGGITD